MRLYEKLDLMVLKILGATAAQVGFYGAAQNLAIIPAIFSLSFAPSLLSTLTRTISAGESEQAKNIARNGMRAVLLMLPFAGMTAGAAPEIVELVFGTEFLPAGQLLSLLIFGTIALAMISVTTAILTAAGKPNWTFAASAPILPSAIIGYWLMIPRLGAVGASIVFTVFANIGALVTVFAIHHLWKILPNFGTIWRSVVICGLSYALASSWVTHGILLLLKLSVIGLLIPLMLFLFGEFNRSEVNKFLSRFNFMTKNKAN
jgi:O-antigen/teichoic acid export membrane protein